MNRSGFQIMRRLIGLVKPLTGTMILAVMMGLIGHLCAAMITVSGGAAILKVLHPEWAVSLKFIFGMLLLLAAARGFLRYAEQACNHDIAFKLLALIRDQVFGALRRLCPAKLEGKDKGNLISMITSDIELLEVFYAHTISPVVIAVLFSLMMTIFIGRFHIGLGALALLAYMTVGVILPILTSALSGDDGLRFRTKNGALSSFVLDGLRGMSEIIQFGWGKNRMAEMNDRMDSLSEDEAKLKRIAALNMAVTNAVILGFDLIMLLLSIQLIGFEGSLMVTLALMSSFGPVVALSALGATLQNTFAAGNRILDLLDESPVVTEIEGKPEVAFEGASAEAISFAYDDEVILDDFSMTIPKHQIVGISGRSGSGKSTFLKLLMRFWEIQKGTVKLSDCNVNEINTSNLREMESLVTQQTHLFHDSIRNNLRIACLEATDEMIMEACKKASVHDFIMGLPKGYDTEVGELGDTLSGGERQRLGLARAFLHDAPFMLLDEPTSNLDSLNEAVILKSLHEARLGKTVLLVSHRQSTMGIADTVYTVENGRMS